MFLVNYLHYDIPLSILLFHTNQVISIHSFKYSYNYFINRALRIYKVLSYYEGYWLLMKHQGEDSEVRMSNYLTKEENLMLQKSKQWRENSLISFMIFNLMVPLFIISFMSFLSPYVYTIIPVYDTNTCWAYFYE